MKKVRYKKFDGSIVVLVILLCIWIIPGLIYWAVKRREFLFDVLTQDELVPELEKFQKLVDKGVIGQLTFEKKRDNLLKLASKASKTADKRKPKAKILNLYQNKINVLRYLVVSAEKIDVVGERMFDKQLKKP